MHKQIFNWSDLWCWSEILNEISDFVQIETGKSKDKKMAKA